VKYCIFGGSFDPPHEGHRYLARSAIAALKLDGLIWIPAPDPPHKPAPSTPFSDRVAMVRLAITGIPRQSVSDIEASLPRPSFTINTVQALKAQLGAEHQWHVLVGSDNWTAFQSWHRWRDLLRAVTMVVFPRRGYPVGDLPSGVLSLDMPPLDAEGTRIRETLAATKDFEASGVLPEIRDYISARGLYGMKGRDAG